MPGTTRLGYRTPNDTDPVANGALAVRNLAADVDTKLGAHASGTATIHVAAAQNGDLAIAFPAGRFTAAPVIAVTAIGNNAFFGSAASAGISATGFTARVVNRDGASTTADVLVHWIAVQQ